MTFLKLVFTVCVIFIYSMTCKLQAKIQKLFWFFGSPFDGKLSCYRSSEDLIHRLFVCIAGVADQLQTNFASDLRNILKSVFLMNASDSSENITDTTSLEASIEYHPTENEVIQNNEFSVDPNILAQEALFDTNVYFHINENNPDAHEYSNHPRQGGNDDVSISSLATDLGQYATIRDIRQGPQVHSNDGDSDRPPIWIPDVEAPKCMSCAVNFTVVKRRHHCRNCGKVFCARCSSNSVPLPKFGHIKPVRVCNKCFIYHLSPFTMWKHILCFVLNFLILWQGLSDVIVAALIWLHWKGIFEHFVFSSLYNVGFKFCLLVSYVNGAYRIA